MKIQGNQFLSMERLQDRYLNPGRQQTENTQQNGLSFQDILSGKTDGRVILASKSYFFYF